jgi:carbonic anhydrase
MKIGAFLALVLASVGASAGAGAAGSGGDSRGGSSNGGVTGAGWSYRVSDRQRGPFSWPGTCAAGRRQSPVNIVDAAEAPQRLRALGFRYQPSQVRFLAWFLSVGPDDDQL